MTETARQEFASLAAREADGAQALQDLGAALVKVLAQGLARYPQPGQGELVEQLERQLGAGAALDYVIRCTPGESLRVRCYLVPATPGADLVPIFEVAADGTAARRAMN